MEEGNLDPVVSVWESKPVLPPGSLLGENSNDNAGQLSKSELQQKLSPTVRQASSIFYMSETQS